MPAAGTPTALVTMATDSAEALEAKAALRQVGPDPCVIKMCFALKEAHTCFPDMPLNGFTNPFKISENISSELMCLVIFGFF